MLISVMPLLAVHALAFLITLHCQHCKHPGSPFWAKPTICLIRDLHRYVWERNPFY